MKCFNCGVDLHDKSKYCPRCGTLFSKNEDLNLYCERDDIKYINIYFSTSNRKLYFYNISLGFLFFNFLYAFYKKLYIEGIISLFGFLLFLFIIFEGAGLFINSMGFFALAIIFSIMLSMFIFFYYLFNFNDIYVSKVRYRINKIVKESSDASEEDIIEICKKDSKPNVFLPIILLVILVIFSIKIFII